MERCKPEYGIELDTSHQSQHFREEALTQNQWYQSIWLGYAMGTNNPQIAVVETTKVHFYSCYMPITDQWGLCCFCLLSVIKKEERASNRGTADCHSRRKKNECRLLNGSWSLSPRNDTHFLTKMSYKAISTYHVPGTRRAENIGKLALMTSVLIKAGLFLLCPPSGQPPSQSPPPSRLEYWLRDTEHWQLARYCVFH